ncbi:hypothetical protein ACIA7S_28705 [Streptomyces sp. NPDC051643]|uniref:hypothetical protein n=1 Tax=Streptomyces sp. NPDC051643 TaxID=3365665 RepID=UPI00379595DF
MTTAPLGLDLPDDEDDLDQALRLLPHWKLSHLASRADAILEARNAARLPELVRSAVGEALAAEEAALGVGVPRKVQPAPLSITFTTTSFDNGYFWDESDPVVAFTDGHTRTLDLDECGDLRDELSDHAEWVEPKSDTTLRVTFEPAGLHVQF